ncbi:MAG: DegV family protein [Chloroflexi bacterium]|nr:DegV family protein [Chloroflexota bacterium]
MLHIVMDGSGDMPPEWASTYDIEVVPIHLHIGDKTFLQGVDLNDDDFYRLVEQTRIIPKTAVPSPYQFMEFYRHIARPGDTILSMHVSGKLSSMVTSAERAARELAGELNVIAFDSGNGSAGLGYMCRDARMLERAGESLQTIIKRMAFIRDHMNIIFTIDTLEYAHLSGRVKALQAALSSLFSIKPIIALREGALDMAERVRTRQKALTYIIDNMKQRLGEQAVNVAVVHARAPEAGQQLLERVRATLNCREIILTNLSIAVSAHLGPGTVGIVAYPVQEK